MALNFHRIAYEALEVCNAVGMDRIDAAVARTGVGRGAGVRRGDRALDIGCGNGAVSIRLAEALNLSVTAVEFDPAMAALAADRIAASPARDHIHLHQGRSDTVLNTQPPFDLIVGLGTTEPVGDGIRDPQGMFCGLTQHLAPGGHLLWGDLVWLSEPPAPLRQIVELQNLYTDDAGWQAAANEAGLEVMSAEISSQSEWDLYGQTMIRAVTDWTTAHPDHPDTPALMARTRQVEMMFQFGHGFMGFGLYLLAKA